MIGEGVTVFVLVLALIVLILVLREAADRRHERDPAYLRRRIADLEKLASTSEQLKAEIKRLQEKLAEATTQQGTGGS